MGRQPKGKARGGQRRGDTKPAPRAQAKQANQAKETGPPPSRLLQALNPIRPGPPSRSRAARFAVICALVALLLAAVGAARGRAGWQPPAIMLGILAVLWGIRAATMR
jgi:hypothetical protein